MHVQGVKIGEKLARQTSKAQEVLTRLIAEFQCYFPH